MNVHEGAAAMGLQLTIWMHLDMHFPFWQPLMLLQVVYALVPSSPM
jgi:hypothetical protein